MPGSAVRTLRVYNGLLLVVGVLAAPLALLICLLRPPWRRGLAARLGLGWPAPTSPDVLWAHAASVGEVEGIAPLVLAWQAAHPQGHVVFSALTGTGCDAARRVVPGASVRAFPLDFGWISRAVVRRIRPRLFLFSENEIWPNAIAALADEGIPVVQVSGRVSAGTAQALARFPTFARAVLGRVSRFCVQEEEHRERLLDLGVSADRIVVTGSLKGDAREPQIASFVAALATLGRPVIVAGSTHPGEESALLDAVTGWHAPRPFLVLAPRHPDRFAQVASLLSARGERFVLRSALAADASPSFAEVDVLLLDSLGELAGTYGAASVAFVGGTLVPIGGHNVLEAARAGAPVVVGAHCDNVRPLVERLVAEGAGRIAPGAEGLRAALADFVTHPEPAVRLRARAVAREGAGALAETWRALEAVATPSALASGDAGAQAVSAVVATRGA